MAAVGQPLADTAQAAARAAGDRLSDRALTPAVNDLCAEFGVPPARNIVREWWHSPRRVIGLFPDWYAAVQPDWPPQTRLTGFPLYDEADATPLTPELDRWVDAGEPPVVFVPGTANRQAARFFQAGADACRRLGRRGLLLSRFSDQIPGPLPPGVRHAEYAPFGSLLPRAAALVHHGGIGTAAQALRNEYRQAGWIWEGRCLLLHGEPIPDRAPIETHQTGSEYRDGIWALIDVDVSRLSSRTRRVGARWPAREGDTRSGLLARAALSYAECRSTP